MFKLNKKGFSIIEVLCSISILSIAITVNTSMIVKSLRIKNYNDNLQRYSYFTEALKNNLVYNLEFKDFKSLENKKLYIDESDFKVDILKENRLNEIIKSAPLNTNAYIELMLKEEENYIISIKLYYPQEKINIRTAWQGEKEVLPL
ncbi:prepilin-type N-terminal cleavage/methylation domain-containing protein [Clostridium pascui]|uniref:type IV pilus modification PilV family protein n=1 Tax=Clostridium pascui TaxID=46609 RepID=UPI00195CDC76|nr:prepilin-type N-terminal cleavage/methylation domain-containing protein [Clostridium pascui]MBM7869272.1 prepilin-type N-terminal cleavage/methylation domain-containing protein [Clostridium pascui]